MKERKKLSNRSWYLLSMIDNTSIDGSKFCITNKELSAHLECTEKTITKNIKILREMGYVNEYFEPNEKGLSRVLVITESGHNLNLLNPLHLKKKNA